MEIAQAIHKPTALQDFQAESYRTECYLLPIVQELLLMHLQLSHWLDCTLTVYHNTT